MFLWWYLLKISLDSWPYLFVVSNLICVDDGSVDRCSVQFIRK
ncbi:hypothetical protein [Richelia intracellularis]